MFISFNEKQPENIFFGISVNDERIDIFVNKWQSWKTEAPTFFTEEGIVISVNEKQLENASWSIFVTNEEFFPIQVAVEGMVTSERDLQEKKNSSLIDVI